VSNSLHDQADDRFNSQRENFANLYISGTPEDNADVIYGDTTSREKQRTGDEFAVNDFRHLSGKVNKSGQWSC